MRFFSRFQKPSRYMGGELNAVRKDAPLKVALAFPDVYEVGMSHLGLKILYEIINQIPYASAERVFHPWADLEAHMREAKLPLRSLEWKRPLREFDVVGFSLQYELSYTSVLNMLELGGIPLHSEERIKGNFPLVIAGGPCTVNPAPMSPFMDAFLIGDGEEAVPEILEAVWRWKSGGDGNKQSLLRELAKIPGVYVPSVHQEGEKIRRRYITSLEDAPYPTRPVLPFTPLVHDRVNIEVSRGCSMGCRFCQAGLIYRPLRERRPERVLELARKALASTGYEEVAFTSLSAGDYSCLLPLIREVNRKFRSKKISVSLPSLRVKAVNENVLKEIKSVRKTGFTIAPEAGTDRLRSAINKDFSEEDFEKALEILFREGWLNLKLYFMIGLPTETGEDLDGIPLMAMKALQTAKKYTGRYVNLTISASSFVPKAHTPFQWEAQDDMEELKRKKAYLRKTLTRKSITFKSHDERMSLLEAAFARGDREISKLLLRAHRLGARLDAWGDIFDFNIWLRAMEETGINAAEYAQKKFETGNSLPWEMVDTGIEKAYLIREYKAAYSGKKTPDCGTSCAACGLKCEIKGKKAGEEITTEVSVKEREPEMTSLPGPGARFRIEFSKRAPLQFLSHRELITAITRAANRAELPLEFSRGFHPAPKIAFGPPLGVGVEGFTEYFDISLTAPLDPEKIKTALNENLPEGLIISAVEPLNVNEESLQSFISRYVYEIIGIDPQKGPEFLKKEKFPLLRGEKEIDIRELVIDVEKTGNDSVKLVLEDTEKVKVRLDEIIKAIFGKELHEVDARRTMMQGRKEGELVSPIPLRSAPLRKGAD